MFRAICLSGEIIPEMKPSRESELFYQALEQPTGERLAFIEMATQAKPELRENVLRRLELLERLPDFLEKPYLSASQTNSEKTDFRPGAMIGPYRVVRQLGLGGMGEVFLVEQESPIQRRLALKVLKTSLARTDALLRLEAERQTLAVMNHPNISWVIDGGALADGSPYFVMEYVEGVAITDFARARGLDVHQRLALFLDVCEAIRHAHQKGVIHRDIKPSNILVAEAEGKPVPKVIDFGLAKWSSEIGGLKPYQTGNWRVLGTLPYVSPEQLARSSAGVDTRTDLYSLGVLLFELLTGVTPFENASVPSPIADLELARRIREEEPPRLALAMQTTKTADAVLNQSWQELPGMLAADLGWIVQKALAKSPEGRYTSVAEFAGDIRHALANDPIIAGPPDWRTRLAKMVRRHRSLILAGSTGFAMLLLAIAGLTTGLFRARQAEKLADQRFEQAHRALQEASRSREATQQANRKLAVSLEKTENALRDSDRLAQFLEDVFQSIHKDIPSRQVRLVDVIQKATDKFRNSLDVANANHARLFFAMGNRLFFEREYKLAIEPFEMAWKIQSRTLGETSKETIGSAVRLGRSYEMTGELEKARALNDAAIASIEKSTELTADYKNYQLRATKLNQARILEQLGEYDRAMIHLDELHSLIPVGDINLAKLWMSKARIYQKTNRSADSIMAAESAVAVADKNVGPARLITFGLRMEVAILMHELKSARLEPFLKQTEEQIRVQAPTNSENYNRLIGHLAETYEKCGLKERATALRTEMESHKAGALK